VTGTELLAKRKAPAANKGTGIIAGHDRGLGALLILAFVYASFLRTAAALLIGGSP